MDSNSSRDAASWKNDTYLLCALNGTGGIVRPISLLRLLLPDTPRGNVGRLAAPADGENPSTDGRRINATIATAQAAHALVAVQVMTPLLRSWTLLILERLQTGALGNGKGGGTGTMPTDVFSGSLTAIEMGAAAGCGPGQPDRPCIFKLRSRLTTASQH